MYLSPQKVRIVMVEMLEDEQLSMWTGLCFPILLPKSFLDKILAQLINQGVLCCRYHAPHDTTEIGQVKLGDWSISTDAFNLSIFNTEEILWHSESQFARPSTSILVVLGNDECQTKRRFVSA